MANRARLSEQSLTKIVDEVGTVDEDDDDDDDDNDANSCLNAKNLLFERLTKFPLVHPPA